jgi:hypothetical protein
MFFFRAVIYLLMQCSLTELVSLITVRVTEPLLFFFCRFYQDMPQVCIWYSSSLCTFSIWILTFSKISDWRKKGWITTTNNAENTGVFTKNMLTLRKLRVKLCYSALIL